MDSRSICLADFFSVQKIHSIFMCNILSYICELYIGIYKGWYKKYIHVVKIIFFSFYSLWIETVLYSFWVYFKRIRCRVLWISLYISLSALYSGLIFGSNLQVQNHKLTKTTQTHTHSSSISYTVVKIQKIRQNIILY